MSKTSDIPDWAQTKAEEDPLNTIEEENGNIEIFDVIKQKSAR